MKKGDKGNKVKNLQRKLNKIMSVALVVDGHFGQDTYLIVLRFQEQNNLTMDGIVGRVTMSAINNQYIQMMESSNLMTFGKNRFVIRHQENEHITTVLNYMTTAIITKVMKTGSLRNSSFRN
jgi:hypothetical protein